MDNNELKNIDYFEFENTPLIDCYSLNNIEVKETEWLWQDRIPKNTLTIIEGDGGRGKSTIIADLCARLSNEIPLPCETEACKPLKILMLTREDDPSIVLKPRLINHNANLDNIFFSGAELLLNEEGLSKLRHTIRKLKIELVIIDPIVSFIGTRIDMNKSSDVRSVLGCLIDIGTDFGCTIIVVRHFNKTQNCSPSQKGSGSVDFRNSARSVLQVHFSPELNTHFLAVDKSNYSVIAPALPFNIKDKKIQWLAPIDISAEDINTIFQKSAIDEAMIFLKTELSSPLPAKDVMKRAREAGHSERTIRRASYKLGIRKTKTSTYWQWSLPMSQVVQEDQKL